MRIDWKDFLVKAIVAIASAFAGAVGTASKPVNDSAYVIKEYLTTQVSNPTLDVKVESLIFDCYGFC